MNEKIVDIVSQILIGRLNYVAIENFDLDCELKIQKNPFTGQALTGEDRIEIEKRLLEFMHFKRSHDSAVLIPVSIVADPKEHEEWYDDWLDKNNNEISSYYWKRLEDYLSGVLTDKYGPEEAGRIVKSIDEATYGIIKKLENPNRRTFNTKGLVVGYVQSGKTANFTALIAKAADAGYKFIIVLAGIHNILRIQTQIRLDKELTGMNDRCLAELFINEPSDAKVWNRLSSARYENGGEFAAVNLDPFSSFCKRATPTLAVIKKNVTVLENLTEYIKEADARSRSKMPLLIIDDEADQASIDTKANDPDTRPSATNECIRTLLALFPKKAYVGYTATPFANVLIDMKAQDEILEDDLYPRNFIVSLPEPEGYFGTATIFQGELSNAFVKKIDENKKKQKDEESKILVKGKLTVSLIRAIEEFIICCAVRNIRGHRIKPMSMLIHVSHKIRDMEAVYKLVDDYLGALNAQYGDSKGKELLRKEYRQRWSEFKKDARLIDDELSLNNRLPEYSMIWNEVDKVLSVVRCIQLNSMSEDKLDYTKEEEIKVIAIGGNQLSRGLTLEGLMTSYYLRPSRQYDTLLQMGRWFGYRKGYEDLTRVHTTELIWESFRHLALVEEEMRSEIYRYEEEDKTPAEVAIAIRDHRRLNVTSPNKMGAAKLRKSSFSGQLNQTIWLPLDKPEALKANYRLGSNFISTIGKSFEFRKKDSQYLARNVPGDFVLNEFLKKYTFVDNDSISGAGLDSKGLLEYIDRRMHDKEPELLKWNVCVISNVNASKENKTIEYGGLKLNPIQRSRKHTSRGYNVGVLTEPDHLRIDLPAGIKDPMDKRQTPLLLMYLLWKNSKAKENIEIPREGQRIDLYRYLKSEKVDVLGLAFVIPNSKREPYSYIGQ